MCNVLMCITIEKNIFISWNMTGFHCLNTDFGFRGPFLSCFFICLFVVLHIGWFHFIYVSTIPCWRIFQTFPRECSLQLHGNFYLAPALQKILASESSQFFLSNLTQNLYLHVRNGPTWYLPASFWFQLDRFLLLVFTATAAAAAAAGRLYFICIMVRTFFLWRVFCQSRIFHCVCRALNVC